MIEASANEVSEDAMLDAMAFAQQAISEFCEAQSRFAAMCNPVPLEVFIHEIEEPLRERVFAAGMDKMRSALRNPDKQMRVSDVAAVKEEVTAGFTEDEIAASGKNIHALLKELEKKTMRAMVLDEGERVDGRKVDEIRKVNSSVGYLPRAHGSGLFTRGQTQVLSVLTLGMLSEWQRIDTIDVSEGKRYLHHYNFPPFCTGEIGFMRGPKRREIGHGALAERALLPVLPDQTDFPYTIRIVSEVLESNGSSSMGSVCGSTLALMDAGVPITAPVSGVAMGLIKEGEKVAVLSDIQGLEDFLGDMDFKVAGSAKGITALQMDNKAKGLNHEILGMALKQAKVGLEHILGEMLKAIDAPRKELKQYAPRILTIRIPTDKIRDVIGSGGKIVRAIQEETGAQIDIQEDGVIFIASRDEGGEEARRRIELIVREPEIGEKYLGRVVSTQAFGAFIELLPGKDGLLHISRVAKGRVEKVEDMLNVGDEVEVEIIDIDDRGKVSLDRLNKPDAPKGQKSESASRDGSDDRDRGQKHGSRPHGDDRKRRRRH